MYYVYMVDLCKMLDWLSYGGRMSYLYAAMQIRFNF